MAARKPKDKPAPAQKRERPVETSADRRNYLRRMAGWPAEKAKG
jgi:hypothetical protein